MPPLPQNNLTTAFFWQSALVRYLRLTRASKDTTDDTHQDDEANELNSRLLLQRKQRASQRATIVLSSVRVLGPPALNAIAR